MTDIIIQPPRVLQMRKPVRLVLTGGFLGAGKSREQDFYTVSEACKSFREEALSDFRGWQQTRLLPAEHPIPIASHQIIHGVS